MQPDKFPEANLVIAQDQPEYQPLPAYRGYNYEHQSTSLTFCWKLSWRERLRVLLHGRVWDTVLTFGSPLQPRSISTERPDWVFVKEPPQS